MIQYSSLINRYSECNQGWEQCVIRETEQNIVFARSKSVKIDVPID